MKLYLFLIALFCCSTVIAGGGDDNKSPSKKRARCQITEDLALTDITLEADIERPVVCVGTGRNSAVMKLKHLRQTSVGANDVCIDLERRIEPDYICNGWEISRLTPALPSRHFAAVHFAHVGSLGIPLFDELLVPTLQRYLSMLLPGGALIFNSEVYFCEEALQRLAERYGFADFESLKAKWVRLFRECGYSQIQVVIKKEDANYFTGCFSILLVAKKAGAVDTLHAEHCL